MLPAVPGELSPLRWIRRLPSSLRRAHLVPISGYCCVYVLVSVVLVMLTRVWCVSVRCGVAAAAVVPRAQGMDPRIRSGFWITTLK